MGKSFKKLFFIVGGIILLIVVAFFLIGPEYIEKGRQEKSAEDIYAPSGYLLTDKNRKIEDEKGDVFYVTTLKRDDKFIFIYAMKKVNQSCKGTIKSFDNIEVCFLDKGSSKDKPTKRTAIWDKFNTTFQLVITDPALSEVEIGKIISSIN